MFFFGFGHWVPEEMCKPCGPIRSQETFTIYTASISGMDFISRGSPFKQNIYNLIKNIVGMNLSF
jgi:hypothetical protein